MTGKFWKFGIGIGVIVAVVGWLAVSGFEQNKTYYVTVQELVSGKSARQRIRVGGVVADGSIERHGGQVRFRISQDAVSVPVVYVGTDTLPDTFVAGSQAGSSEVRIQIPVGARIRHAQEGRTGRKLTGEANAFQTRVYNDECSIPRFLTPEINHEPSRQYRRDRGLGFWTLCGHCRRVRRAPPKPANHQERRARNLGLLRNGYAGRGDAGIPDSDRQLQQRVRGQPFQSRPAFLL
jgi:hypothetical protein